MLPSTKNSIEIRIGLQHPSSIIAIETATAGLRPTRVYFSLACLS
jgi:hypothetical protein